MPYIHPADRPALDIAIDAMPVPKSAGELNYVLSRIAKRYANSNGANYQAMNDVMGAFDGASREFYRRTVAPYEDMKLEQNGDFD